MRWERSSVSGERTRDGARFRSRWERRWTRDVAGRRVDTHLGGDGGRGLRRRGSRGVRPLREPRGYQGRISRRNRRRGAPPGSATGSFGASLIVPCRGNYEGALGAPDSDVSLGAGSRVCRGLGGVSVAFDLVSRLMEVRAGVRVVLARLRAGGRVARVDCLARGESGSPKQPVGRFRFRDPTPQHDGNLTQNGAENRAADRASNHHRLIASVFSFRRVPSPKKETHNVGAVARSPRGARRRCRRIVFDDTTR